VTGVLVLFGIQGRALDDPLLLYVILFAAILLLDPRDRLHLHRIRKALRAADRGGGRACEAGFLGSGK